VTVRQTVIVFVFKKTLLKGLASHSLIIWTHGTAYKTEILM